MLSQLNVYCWTELFKLQMNANIADSLLTNWSNKYVTIIYEYTVFYIE
jgi:hypothetical protein